MVANTYQLLIESDKKLNQLRALKMQIWFNFPGSTEKERDAVLDIIAAVCNREESFSAHLREKLISEL